MASDASTGEALLRWRRAQDARVTASAAGTPSRVAPGEGEVAAGQRAPRWWPEAALVAPLALYSHGYRRCPLPAGDGDGEATACRHCPFLLAERGPFLVAPLLPPEPAFGLGTEGPAAPGEGGYGSDWHPAPYVPSWGQPLYLSPPPRRKAAPGPFDGTVGSGDKDLYPPKDPVFPLLAEEGVPCPLPRRAPAGTARQDGDADPNPTGHPLLLLPPSTPRGSWAGTWPHADRFPSEPAPESLAHPCPAAASPPAPREPSPRLCPLSQAEEPAGCVCVPAGHPAKLKQTWLTRHSAQCSPRCKAPTEGKRAPKRPHGTGEAAGATKRGTRAMERAGTPEGTAIPAEQPGEGGAGPRERWHLQSVPCTALPAGVPRCCACAARGDPGGDNEDDESPESACRLLHFRRLAPGPGGELRVAGVCSLEDAQGQTLRLGAGGTRHGDAPGDPRTAKYLLTVLGDAFCEAVRRDRAAWRAAAARHQGAAWRRGDGAPRLCDICQRGLFNSHWSCPRCGFQLCPDCHGRGRHERSRAAAGPECVPGQQHDAGSLVPTQFVPTHVLTELWTLLHEVRARAGIPARCPCAAGDQGSPQEEPEMPHAKPSGAGKADASRTVKEASPTCAPGAPAHGARLRDLLASTAVKLCPAHGAVRMAFAPVSPALPDDAHMASLLESVIARVVERKIQERHAVPSGDTAASHRLLATGGPLWLLQPELPSGYALFQQHWRQGQPVLVSGLQERLGVPEALRPPSGECQLKVQDGEVKPSGVHVATERFWDAFARSSAEPRCDGDPESSLGDAQPWRAAELGAFLPLREYCSPRGRLNLAAHLRGERGARWLRPRLRAAHGSSQDGGSGTKLLAVEAADSVSVLVHAGAVPCDGPGLLLRAEEAGVAAVLRERLGDARCCPGALWHVFRAEDAGRIRGFLQRVGAPGAAHPGSSQSKRDAGTEPGTCYLDVRLLQRLRDECGVSGWALLQCVGDAVLVPAGAPHQVQTLTDTISVEQRFLSPESAARLRDPSTGTTGIARHLRAQLDAMIFAAVREAVGVLQGCK